MFYEQHLCAQILKAKKYSQSVSLFALLGSGLVKAARLYTVDEIDTFRPFFLSVLTIYILF